MANEFQKLTVKIDLFTCQVLVYCGRWENCVDWFPKDVPPRCPVDPDYDGLSIVCERSDRIFSTLIWIEKPNYAVLAHEAAHVAGYICHNFGILADFNNDEMFCYILGHIMKKCRKLGLK